MNPLIERAKQLINQNDLQEKCPQLVKNLRRKLEDLDDASKAGNLGVGIGIGLIVVGAVVSFFVPPLGIGIAIGGAVTTTLSADKKIDAIRKAVKELRRAIEDLEECRDR